jgi:hypothetical protein
MTIQVYTFTEQEEKALLAFLESGHYNYKSTSGDELSESEFLDQYNKDLEEAEAQIDKGDFLSHSDVRKFFANKKRHSGGN